MSHESEETAHDAAGCAQTVATSVHHGGSEGRTMSASEKGRTKSKRGRRGEYHRIFVRDGLPCESVEPAESPLWPANISLESGKREKETVKCLKRKLLYMGKEKNELNDNVSRMSVDYIQKETFVKALTDQF